ncbi:hypothetical protein Y032_0012g1666 [Ancylostoma ceylanicum]|uniref:Uncharacterized protein n=1 Tax=Ancylostoma ceylanicum TaxID=53326 RepID=A0A016VDH8_9BILA|nr:hypothetical protein Y032_0012g1666 [Ancylostoma ceylanicum]
MGGWAIYHIWKNKCHSIFVFLIHFIDSCELIFEISSLSTAIAVPHKRIRHAFRPEELLWLTEEKQQEAVSRVSSDSASFPSALMLAFL